MRPPLSDLLALLGHDGLWHAAVFDVARRHTSNRGRLALALCLQEVRYAGDEHVVTCIFCLSVASAW